MAPLRVAHLLRSLTAAGMERVALELALAGRAAGDQHEIFLFDADGVREQRDLDPAGVPVRSVMRRRGLDWRYPARLRRELRAAQVDAVHAHNDTALVYAAWALRSMTPRPRLVATFHNLPVHASVSARWLARRAGRRADALVCVSADLARRLESDGWLARSHVIRNGVDCERFAPRARANAMRAAWAISPNTFVIGCVARLVPGKRHRDLIEAAKIARIRGLDLHLVLVGDGELREDLAARAAGTVPITFVPFERNPEQMLPEFDAVALVSDHEGLPMSLLEAMACGLPVLATRTGGIPELLGDGEACGGSLVEVGDVAAMVASLNRLANLDYRQLMGQRARAHACAAHDRAQVASAYRLLYQ